MSKRACWHGGRAYSKWRGPGFDPHWWHRVVSLSNRARHTNFPEYWLLVVNALEAMAPLQCYCKFVDGTLNLNPIVIRIWVSSIGMKN